MVVETEILEWLVNNEYTHADDVKLYKADLNKTKKYIHKIDNFFIADPQYLQNMGLIK